jgi:toxin YoeB
MPPTAPTAASSLSIHSTASEARLHPQGWEDCTDWQRADRSILQHLNRLLDDARRDPTVWIGKPEPLKNGISGAQSRRVTDEHRLVYRPAGGDLIVLQARHGTTDSPAYRTVRRALRFRSGRTSAL